MADDTRRRRRRRTAARALIVAAVCAAIAYGAAMIAWAMGKAAHEGAQWQRQAYRDSAFRSQHERRA